MILKTVWWSDWKKIHKKKVKFENLKSISGFSFSRTFSPISRTVQDFFSTSSISRTFQDLYEPCVYIKIEERIYILYFLLTSASLFRANFRTHLFNFRLLFLSFYSLTQIMNRSSITHKDLKNSMVFTFTWNIPGYLSMKQIKTRNECIFIFFELTKFAPF